MRQRRFVSPFVIRWPSKTPVQIMVKRNDVLALELNATSFCYRATSGKGVGGAGVCSKGSNRVELLRFDLHEKRKKKEKYSESLKTMARSRRRKKAPSSRGFLRVESKESSYHYYHMV